MTTGCPACAGAPALTAMPAAGATLGFCGSCRGLWIGAEQWRAALGRPLDGAAPAVRARGLGCPDCGPATRLDTLAVSGPPLVEIDRCPRCAGTWLDAGEMSGLRAALRRAGAAGADVAEAWGARAAAPAGATPGAPSPGVPREILATDRPDPAYWIMTLLGFGLTVVATFGLMLPLVLIALLPAYFRYHTTRYTFDDEGIGMSWGLIFQHATHVTYGKIQDIHLNRGLLERWLGLGTVRLQTASGSAAAEVTLYGLKNADVVRDYLYQRMRGWKEHEAPTSTGPDAVALLAEIRDEVERLRRAVEGRP